MLVDNKNLFPLNLVYPELRDYYMDGEGDVYSTKRNKLSKLWGSTTSGYSRGYRGGRTYTLAGQSYNGAALVDRASAHSDFKSHTHDPHKKTPGGYGPATLSAAALGVDLTKVKAPIPPINRTHATSVEQGIEGKGWFIAAYKPETGLIFSKQPAIHLTIESAKSEMERLAKEVPGTKFVLMRILNTIVSGGVTWA